MKTAVRFGKILFVLLVLIVGVLELQAHLPTDNNQVTTPDGTSPAATALAQLPVKGRAPKTGYQRSLFANGWTSVAGCDMRNRILARDLTNITYTDTNPCKVQAGTLNDPYTGTVIQFVRGSETSSAVQIDHVVALSDAWQKGAQNITAAERFSLANDPLNLLAVDGKTNQNKGDGDAATWLPPHKSFRCNYVARQIAVKTKYKLWVTVAEHDAIAKALSSCPEQELPQTAHYTI